MWLLGVLNIKMIIILFVPCLHHGKERLPSILLLDLSTHEK